MNSNPWELVWVEDNSTTDRMIVTDLQGGRTGWIYRTRNWDGEGNVSCVALVFVPVRVQ